MIQGQKITKFMGPTWGPPGPCRPQMGPMLAPGTLLSGMLVMGKNTEIYIVHICMFHTFENVILFTNNDNSNISNDNDMLNHNDNK